MRKLTLTLLLTLIMIAFTLAACSPTNDCTLDDVDYDFKWLGSHDAKLTIIIEGINCESGDSQQ